MAARVVDSRCVCGAAGFNDGTFNALHNNGVCNHNGGAGADGNGGHTYNIIGMFSFVFFYFAFACVVLPKQNK